MFPTLIRFRAFVLLVPFFAIIGAAGNHSREWLGELVGACIGLFFALMVSGMLPAKVIDAIFPGEPIKEEVDDSV